MSYSVPKKGDKLEGPDGEYYIVTRDVSPGDYVLTSDFEPRNGAPTPKPNEPLPTWLAKMLYGE